MFVSFTTHFIPTQRRVKGIFKFPSIFYLLNADVRQSTFPDKFFSTVKLSQVTFFNECSSIQACVSLVTMGDARLNISVIFANSLVIIEFSIQHLLRHKSASDKCTRHHEALACLMDYALPCMATAINYSNNYLTPNSSFIEV